MRPARRFSVFFYITASAAKPMPYSEAAAAPPKQTARHSRLGSRLRNERHIFCFSSGIFNILPNGSLCGGALSSSFSAEIA